MKLRTSQIIFQLVLTLILFSVWAGFALLVVNQYFYRDLPGYTIGRICVWEGVALLIAFLIARQIIRKWGNIEFQKLGIQRKLIFNPNYGLFFLIYFGLAIGVGIWQFYLFSQNF